MQLLFVVIRGAGSLVNRDVKDFEIVVGNPIRNIGWISIEGEKLDFRNNNEVILNGTKYTLNNNEVKILKS